MAKCEAYERLKKEFDMVFQYEVLPWHSANRNSCGVSEPKRKNKLKDGQEKQSELSTTMFNHRQSCAVCKAEDA